MTAQGYIQLKIMKKTAATPGEQVRAVGMCFYWPVTDLIPGNSHRLCYNPLNPRDVSCIKVKEITRLRATLNGDISRLLPPYLDVNMLKELTWLVTSSP